MPDRDNVERRAELEVAHRIRAMAEQIVEASPTPITLTQAIDIVVVGLRSMGSKVADGVIRAAETQAAVNPSGPNRAQRRAAARRRG